jgi:hypothetical protein
MSNDQPSKPARTGIWVFALWVERAKAAKPETPWHDKSTADKVGEIIGGILQLALLVWLISLFW